MKSPNPTKNKPTNTKCWTGKIQKLQRFNNQPPTRRGTKEAGQNIRETCSTTPHAHRTKQMTQSIIGIQPRHHRHTPTTGHTPHSAQNEAGEHTHATKVHWHTIEFSNNTSTPTNQNQTRPQPEKAASSEATQPTNQKSNSR